MRIMGKNYDNKALGLGALGALALMVVPKVSEPVIEFVQKVRTMVSGFGKRS